VSNDDVTPSWTIIDIPNPFAVTDQITPYTELAENLDV